MYNLKNLTIQLVRREVPRPEVLYFYH